jgi:hypothetical protein
MTNSQKVRIEIKFVLPLSLGNTARHPQVLCPQKEKVNLRGGKGNKGVLVNTWAYTRTFKETGIWGKGNNKS